MVYSIEYIYRILNQYSPVLDKISNDAEKFANKTKESAGRATGAMNLFKTAVGSILTAQGLEEIGMKAFEFGKDCAAAAEKSNASLTLLKNNLKNLGQSSAFPELQKKAEELSKTSIFSGLDILTGSTAALTRFKDINGASFDVAQQAALNMTASMYGVNASQEQLASTAGLVGRAMETGNIRVFSRMGVTFTAIEQKQMEYLKKVGDIPQLVALVSSKLANAPGLKNAMEALAKTPEGMERQIKAQMEDMKVNIGNSLSPLISKLMSLAKDAMPAIQTAIEKLTPKITDMVNGFIKLLPIIGKVAKAIWDHRAVLLGLIAAIIAYNIAMGISTVVTNIHIMVTKAAAIANALFNSDFMIMTGLYIAQYAPIVGLTIVKIAHTVATGALTAAQWALNVAMAACPIILIIAGIAALAIGIYLLVTHWKQVTKAVEDFGKAAIKWIIGVFETVNHTIDNLLKNPIFAVLGYIFLPFITVPKLIINNWTAIKTFFTGLWHNITTVFQSAVHTIGSILTAIANFFATPIKGVKDFFGGIVKAISGLLNNPVIAGIASIFTPFVSIPALIIKNWGNISAFLGKIFTDISNFPAFKFIADMFAKGSASATINNVQAPIAQPSTPEVNVNTSTSISAYTEKGIKVVPYNSRYSKRGYQAAGA